MKKNLTACLIFCAFLLTVQGVAQSAENAAPMAAAISSTPPAEQPVIATPPVRYLQWVGNDQSAKDPIYITQGSSQVLRLNRSVTRVSISNPDICDVTPLGTQEILVHAKGTGSVNLMLWDEDFNLSSYNVQSIIDIDKLKQIVEGVDPNAGFKIVPFNGTAAIYGSTQNAQKLGQINAAATAFNPAVLSFVKIANPKQVLLEVRFAEITRTGNQNWGVDFQALWGTAAKTYNFNSVFGDLGIAKGSSASVAEGFGGTSDFPSLIASGGNADLQLTQNGQNQNYSGALQWLVAKGIAKIIARPNLLARDGEQAEFLVGGEFPVPVSTSDKITVDYRPYGTQLTFTPRVLDEGIIRLEISTDVSELDFSSPVSVGAGVVPSVIRRHQKTVSELKDNQTMVIGGMLTQRISYTEKKLPVLGDTPIIEGAFKRMDTTRTDVELIVVITPHIVSPFEMSDQKQFYMDEDIKRIEDGTRIFTPPFKDLQADSVRAITAQHETFQELNYGSKTKELYKRITGDYNNEQKVAVENKDSAIESSILMATVAAAKPQAPHAAASASSDKVDAEKTDWKVIPGNSAAATAPVPSTSAPETKPEENNLSAATSSPAAAPGETPKVKQKKVTTSEEIIYYQ